MTPDSLVYTRTCRIRPHHVNMNQVLRTSSLLRLMQDTSVAHTEALGLTKEKTLEQGLLWVIARQHIACRSMMEIFRYVPGRTRCSICSFPGVTRSFQQTEASVWSRRKPCGF